MPEHTREHSLGHNGGNVSRNEFPTHYVTPVLKAEAVTASGSQNTPREENHSSTEPHSGQEATSQFLL